MSPSTPPPAPRLIPVEVWQHQRRHPLCSWNQRISGSCFNGLPPRCWCIWSSHCLLDEPGMGDQDEDVVEWEECARRLPIRLARDKTYLDDRGSAWFLQRTGTFTFRRITWCHPVHGVRITEEQLECHKRRQRSSHEHRLLDPQCRQQDVRWKCHLPIPSCEGASADLQRGQDIQQCTRRLQAGVEARRAGWLLQRVCAIIIMLLTATDVYSLMPNLVRVLPSTCVTFLVYENTKFYLPRFYRDATDVDDDDV